MILPLGSTETLTLGPFLTTGGVPVADVLPVVTLYAGGRSSSPGGGALIVQTDAKGVAFYTPGPSDLAAAGELLIVGEVSGAMEWFRWHQVGSLDVDLNRRVLGNGGSTFFDIGVQAGVPSGQAVDVLPNSVAMYDSDGNLLAVMPNDGAGTWEDDSGNYLQYNGGLDGSTPSWYLATPATGETQFSLTDYQSPWGEQYWQNPAESSPPYVVTLIPQYAATAGTLSGAMAGQPGGLASAAQADAIAAQNASAVWANTTRTLTGSGGAIGPTAGISTADIPFRCHPGQTLPLAGQVYDGSGQYATIGETASIAYTVTDCESGESVAGMIGVALTPASVLYDTLQSSAVASNYNLLFSWTAPAKRGTYLIVVTFTGTTGRTWECYFRGQVEW